MRLNKKVCLLCVIRFWSDNAKRLASYGGLHNPKDRLTEGPIIVVLFY